MLIGAIRRGSANLNHSIVRGVQLRVERVKELEAGVENADGA